MLGILSDIRIDSVARFIRITSIASVVCDVGTIRVIRITRMIRMLCVNRVVCIIRSVAFCMITTARLSARRCSACLT